MIDPFFDELPDGVCVTDAEGQVLYMNSAAERLLDVTPQATGGRTLCELLCGHLTCGTRPECASDCPLRGPNPTADAVSFAGRHGPRDVFSWRDSGVSRQSAYKDLRVRCLKTPLGFAGEGRHVALIEDATAESEAKRRAEDWRSMVAHDLRAPLSNVTASLDALAELPEDTVLGEQETRLMKVASRAGKRMVELIDLYLELARLDAGSMPVRLEEVDVSALAAVCVAEQAALASARGLALASELAPGLRAVADPDLLLRVLQNLINNAVKFTLPGGRVTLSAAEEPDGRLAVAVRDTGVGLAAEDLPRIFDRYYQARARREGRIQGNGLGLTFCREAMRVMGGEIGVESQPGRGSAFTLRLPRAAGGAP